MACTRESLLTILTPSLQDVDVSFKEAMEQIGECNTHVNVHIALTCIRLFLCLPVVLLKPVWKKASGQPKQHTVMEWHAVSCDQKRQIVTNYLFYGMVTILSYQSPLHLLQS